jgi:hypothetical protein
VLAVAKRFAETGGDVLATIERKRRQTPPMADRDRRGRGTPGRAGLLDPTRGLRTLVAATATPRHGSWLNIAEIELSALTRQCLDRGIADLATLNIQLAAWQHATNADQRQVDWQFSTADTRIKLRHLYPNS